MTSTRENNTVAKQHVAIHLQPYCMAAIDLSCQFLPYCSTDSNESIVNKPLPLETVGGRLSPDWKGESGCWKALSGTGSVSYARSTNRI